MATKTELALGRLIKRYREDAGLSQAGAAERLRIALGKNPHIKANQGLVAENEHGKRWNLDLPGAYSEALNIPRSEFTVIYGYEKADSTPPRLTWRDIIEADPSLSPAAKEHLINQYGLLQLASQAERAGKSTSERDESKPPRRSNG